MKRPKQARKTNQPVPPVRTLQEPDLERVAGGQYANTQVVVC